MSTEQASEEAIASSTSETVENAIGEPPASPESASGDESSSGDIAKS